jgi:hypothetical protein
LQLSFDRRTITYDVYDKVHYNYISSQTLQFLALGGTRLLIYRENKPFDLLPLFHFNGHDVWLIDLRVRHDDYPRSTTFAFRVHTSEFPPIILSLRNYSALRRSLASQSI